MLLLCRRAIEADLQAIISLLADDVLGGAREVAGLSPDAAYRDAFTAIDRDPNQLLAVAELDCRVVGTLQLTFLPGLSHHGAWRAEIEAVRISGDLRGQGFGRQMFAWAIDQARARSCRLVQLTTNAARVDAQRFYEQLGFARSHIGFKLSL
jgi:GNAT superfamily N-acetyltransferase